jgi:hypothetical protein
MVKPITNFAPNVQWAGHGSGCVLCGRNVSKEGMKQDGLVGVDLEAELDLPDTDAVDGALGLCWDCAVQVGRAVNMERKAVADERLAEADALEAAAVAILDEAKQASAQARLDKDTVVRLLGVDESVPA